MTDAVAAQVDLDALERAYKEAVSTITKRVIVCAGTGCVASGSLRVYERLVAEIERWGLDVEVELKLEEDSIEENATCSGAKFLVSKSGCQGFCQMGPLVTILPENIFYVKVRPEDAPEIVERTLLGGEAIDRLLYVDPRTRKRAVRTSEIQFYAKQKRLLLSQCGLIDPEQIAEYIAIGGYKAAQRAFLAMTPEQICETITRSGLRGRGGGGFPTGVKWEAARKQPGEVKYVICNGDEGDPGAFMDRSVMEGNPHSVLEGMMIAARAIGAHQGYIYVRAEYPLAVKRLRKAINDARAYGLLGQNLFESGYDFDIEVMEGAGAFVCGEETALIASIEGKRGMPRPKPPFPAQAGLWGKPTVINNVETLATVPLIIRNGVDAFREIGTPSSPGTKTFALTGHTPNSGLIEVPFGTTLRDIIFNIGGGVTDSRGRIRDDAFKAVQIGGPSGGCLTHEHLDLPLDFDSLKGVGAMVGSGGLVVMNNQTCMVQVARFFMQFTQNESCGKCVLCREGTKQMLALLDDIIEGRATTDTIELLELLARTVQKGSLCGLGKTAPNPVLSTLRYFREEYEAHVEKKRCPAGQCKALALPTINPEKCKGCGVCARKCPVGAITGERKKPYTINPDLCIRCGACVEACKLDAVSYA
jgi:NADH-quinone oxidoreductase subunit F